ncbi:MAG: tRNA (adenosine(37)-N6)-threonylcarbamoyltransferase complex ATPase subunit type 1 TsaE [Comamonadaceae bacterium]|nr:MAG: tRNA (adenosine(37)-N6)-threonylcarbamoyltransferase complex ATPase subunit type 1 TsaE [Comamonadaceae bacterium]
MAIEGRSLCCGFIDGRNVGNHALIVKNILWAEEAQTELFAAGLAARPAIRQAQIELRGDLGAGKTTFVRHLLRALGVEGRIKSPTYAVVEPYTVSFGETLFDLDLWHFDFYRFNDPDEWEEAGFRDIFSSPGLKLVEWPDKAGEHLPPSDLVIAITVRTDDVREVSLTAYSDTGAALVA